MNLGKVIFKDICYNSFIQSNTSCTLNKVMAKYSNLSLYIYRKPKLNFVFPQYSEICQLLVGTSQNYFSPTSIKTRGDLGGPLHRKIFPVAICLDSDEKKMDVRFVQNKYIYLFIFITDHKMQVVTFFPKIRFYVQKVSKFIK